MTEINEELSINIKIVLFVINGFIIYIIFKKIKKLWKN